MLARITSKMRMHPKVKLMEEKKIEKSAWLSECEDAMIHAKEFSHSTKNEPLDHNLDVFYSVNILSCTWHYLVKIFFFASSMSVAQTLTVICALSYE